MSTVEEVVRLSQINDHHMKGYVVPPALNRELRDPATDEVVRQPLSEHSGATCEIGEKLVDKGNRKVSAGATAIPQILVEMGANGIIKTTELNADAIEILKKKNSLYNKGGKPVDFHTAIKMAASPNTQDAVKSAAAAAAAPVKQPMMAPVAVANDPPPYDPAPSLGSIPVDPPPVFVETPKEMVKFTGPFGSLTVPYSEVFISELCLVMIQRGNSGAFYEAPSNLEEHIKVTWRGETFWCFPGVQYTMPDGQSSHTVFLIDKDETERQHGEK